MPISNQVDLKGITMSDQGDTPFHNIMLKVQRQTAIPGHQLYTNHWRLYSFVFSFGKVKVTLSRELGSILAAVKLPGDFTAWQPLHGSENELVAQIVDLVNAGNL